MLLQQVEDGTWFNVYHLDSESQERRCCLDTKNWKLLYLHVFHGLVDSTSLKLEDVSDSNVGVYHPIVRCLSYVVVQY